MEIIPIFTNQEDCNLWAVCYPEDADDQGDYDILAKLIDVWNDTEKVQTFLINNQTALADPFWKGMTVDQALTQIQREAEFLENELWSIETKQPGFENKKLDSIFQPLHNNKYSINFDNESHRKGKAEEKKPLLRIYAIELDDGTLVVTGGGIKLTRDMEDEIEEEKDQLKRVQEYLRKQGIIGKDGLIV